MSALAGAGVSATPREISGKPRGQRSRMFERYTWRGLRRQTFEHELSDTVPKSYERDLQHNGCPERRGCLRGSSRLLQRESWGLDHRGVACGGEHQPPHWPLSPTAARTDEMRIAREVMRVKEVFMLCRIWVVDSPIYWVRNLCARPDRAHPVAGLFSKRQNIFSKSVAAAACNSVLETNTVRSGLRAR